MTKYILTVFLVLMIGIGQTAEANIVKIIDGVLSAVKASEEAKNAAKGGKAAKDAVEAAKAAEEAKKVAKPIETIRKDAEASHEQLKINLDRLKLSEASIEHFSRQVLNPLETETVAVINEKSNDLSQGIAAYYTLELLKKYPEVKDELLFIQPLIANQVYARLSLESLERLHDTLVQRSLQPSTPSWEQIVATHQAELVNDLIDFTFHRVCTVKFCHNVTQDALIIDLKVLGMTVENFKIPNVSRWIKSIFIFQFPEPYLFASKFFYIVGTNGALELQQQVVGFKQFLSLEEKKIGVSSKTISVG